MYRLRGVSPNAPATRRRFLEASAGVAAAAWLASPSSAATPNRGGVPFVGEGAFPLDTTVGAGLGRRRALDLSVLSPDTLLTPRDKFFVRTGCPDRLPPARSWKVRVHGLVETPLQIPIEELRREATDEGPHLLECAGNSRAAHFGLISAARWSGVRVQRLLERARLRPRATRVLVSGFDEHQVLDADSVPGASWVFGLDDIRDSGAFLATEMNGAPLGPDHGYPVRLVVPGWYACASIKWVNEIVIVDDEAPATDHMREYAGRTHQDPTGPRDRFLMERGRRPEGPPLARDFQPARIDPAAVPVRVEKRIETDGRTTYRIVGILWGGVPRGPFPAHALRIRIDPGLGEASMETTTTGPGSPWTLWSHSFEPRARGRHRIELAIREPGVRTRRLDMAYYAREIEIASD